MTAMGPKNIATSSMLVVFVCVLVAGVDVQGACTKINSCSCTYGADQIVDLSPLEGNPKFLDQYDPQYLNTYSYNPCKAFTEGNCNNVAICQYNGADYYECGSQESATFTDDPTTGNLQIQYTSVGGDGVTRTSIVNLICIQSGDDTLAVTGETSQTLYEFSLSSGRCCPRTGPAPDPGSGGSSGGLSVGSILVIAFFAILIVYVVGGVVFLKFGRKAAGTEAIPNRQFWTAIPGLVKDGTLFVVRRGRGKEYNQI